MLILKLRNPWNSSSDVNISSLGDLGSGEADREDVRELDNTEERADEEVEVDDEAEAEAESSGVDERRLPPTTVSAPLTASGIR